MQLPALCIRRAMFRTSRLFPVSVGYSRGKSNYTEACGWNKFQWLSDSGYPQGYSRSCMKREVIRSSMIVSTKVKVGSSFAS